MAVIVVDPLFADAVAKPRFEIVAIVVSEDFHVTEFDISLDVPSANTATALNC